MHKVKAFGYEIGDPTLFFGVPIELTFMRAPK